MNKLIPISENELNEVVGGKTSVVKIAAGVTLSLVTIASILGISKFSYDTYEAYNSINNNHVGGIVEGFHAAGDAINDTFSSNPNSPKLLYNKAVHKTASFFKDIKRGR